MLWAEHLAALRLWNAGAQSQLRWDQSRPTGIDWVGLRAHPATREIPREQREQVLRDVSVMEPAWVAATVRRMNDAMKRHG